MENQKSFYVTLESDLIFNNNFNSTVKILYAVICFYSNNENGFCYLTYKQLAKIMKITERQIYRSVLELKKHNFINVIKKHNRSYLMPTINQFVELRNKEPEKIKEIFNYDWLNNHEN